MKRTTLLTVLLLSISILAFAGDAAVFENIGFSNDGQTYIFGQYGKLDKTYEAWAEIYTVDVAKNNYVKGEVFTTKPSSLTKNISGKNAFESLKEKSEWKIAKYNCKQSDAANLLYVRTDEKQKPTDEIVFKDYEGSTEEQEIYYHVKLVPTYEGSGKNVKSKYHINLEKKDGNGNSISKYVVGTPDFKRKGISSYKINRIFSDNTGNSVVFIVEKTLEDESGTSIRYMVETVRF